MTASRIQRIYLLLTLMNTLSASFIWGVNTLFLLDAGLNNTQAFAANAFFTLGMVIFEVPTGVVADTWGRRTSYLLGCVTLFVSTLLYLALWHYKLPFWTWAVVSLALGLGFTFFSGALDAWLVDALHSVNFKGALDDIFGRAQVVWGVAMLIGTTAGGYSAQWMNLGTPYILRAGVLVLSFAFAFFVMRDIGFEPRKVQNLLLEVKVILKKSVEMGLGQRSIRWAMLIAPFISGVGIYVFYAAQPFLLELYGDKTAYGVAGLAAALVAGSQIIGGLMVPWWRKLFRRRSTIMIITIVGSSTALIIFTFPISFFPAVIMMAAWALLDAALTPVRQAYLNDQIKSTERATVLSFDGLMGSAGGVVLQPAFGRAADIWGYSTSFVAAGLIQVFAVPFALLIRRDGASSDRTDPTT